MTWPQIVIATWLAGGTVVGAYLNYKDDRNTASTVALALVLSTSWRVAMALVLSAGRFW
jgi:hypothetical protein